MRRPAVTSPQTDDIEPTMMSLMAIRSIRFLSAPGRIRTCGLLLRRADFFVRRYLPMQEDCSVSTDDRWEQIESD